MSNLKSDNRSGKRRPPRALTKAEANALYRAAGQNVKPMWLAARNRAAVVLWWKCGLRVAESLDLLISDIDFTTGEIHIRDGKGHKARIVGIDPVSADILQAWVVVRQAHAINPRVPLLCSNDAKQWGDDGARAMLHRAAERAGIQKDVSPHILRHTMTVEMVREGVPILHVSNALGHSNVATTHRYANHLAPDEVVSSMRGRDW
jgi:integrase/recombinase XerD